MFNSKNPHVFEINDSEWTLVPNDSEGTASFDGKCYPSKSVLDLIGQEGVDKIDSVLKGIKRAKEIIFGVDSLKSGLHGRQYFVKAEDSDFWNYDGDEYGREGQKDLIKSETLAVKKKVHIICSAFDISAVSDEEEKNRTYGIFREGKWNNLPLDNPELGMNSLGRRIYTNSGRSFVREFNPVHDYFMHLPEDVWAIDAKRHIYNSPYPFQKRDKTMSSLQYSQKNFMYRDITEI
ncbi:MAG: hypothetical protein N4A72_22780 [Bacteroidales bacterium]|jgi:hypothetical protein|nr:hypothetical protein [Bacteroidales bacterium]